MSYLIVKLKLAYEPYIALSDSVVGMLIDNECVREIIKLKINTLWPKRLLLPYNVTLFTF